MKLTKTWWQGLTVMGIAVISILFINVTLSPSYDQLSSGNLVRNGSFERSSTNGIPVNWTSNCLKPVSTVRSIGLRDKSSAYLVDDKDDRACGLMSDMFSVESGKNYRLEVDARWDIQESPLVYVYFYKNQVKLGSRSFAIPKGSRLWSRLLKDVQVPVGTDRAQVYLYSPVSRRMKVYFDGVAFYQRPGLQNEVIMYAAPVSSGNGTGLSSKNWALYNDVKFWSVVRTKLAAGPVRVVLKPGNYSIATPAGKLSLKGIGHISNRLTIEGQAAFGTVFLFPGTSISDPGALITLDGVRNTVIRHIHFRSQSNVDIGYLMTVARSENITLAGITALNLPRVKYGVIGPSNGTKNILIRETEMVKLGYDIHQHFIYAFRNIQNLHLNNSVLEDSTGAYFRCRDVCRDLKITDSEFLATGTWGSNDIYKSPHFVELAVFNDQLWDGYNKGQQEWFGCGVFATNNSFQYRFRAGNAIPFSIVHTGYRPWDGYMFRDHLLTSADRELLLNGHVTYRRNMMKSKFGLDLRNGFSVLNNSFSGHLFLFELQSTTGYGSENYYAPSEYAGEGTYDISTCLMQ